MEKINLIREINTIPKMETKGTKTKKIAVKINEIYKMKPHPSAKEITAVYKLMRRVEAEKERKNKKMKTYSKKAR